MYFAENLTRAEGGRVDCYSGNLPLTVKGVGGTLQQTRPACKKNLNGL